MTTPRHFGALALALGGGLVALWRRRRALADRRLADTRFVSRRITDRDARDDQSLEQIERRWWSERRRISCGYPMKVFAGKP